MSQYSAGTVTVTNGSAVVTGSGTSWSSLSAGDLFSIKNSGVYYVVASVDSATQITLSSNYAGVTASGQLYTISTSFTPIFGIAYPEQGDIDTATILKRAISQLETLIKQAISPAYEEIATSKTLAASERGKVLKATGTTTLVLPPISGVEDGWSVWLDPNGNTVTIDPNGAETVNGSGTYAATEFLRLIKISGSWRTVG